MPRDWLVAVCHTIKGDEFVTWVKELVLVRDKVFMEKHNQYIEIDDEIQKVLEASKHTSGKCFIKQNFFLFYIKKVEK